MRDESDLELEITGKVVELSVLLKSRRKTTVHASAWLAQAEKEGKVFSESFHGLRSGKINYLN